MTTQPVLRPVRMYEGPTETRGARLVRRHFKWPYATMQPLEEFEVSSRHVKLRFFAQRIWRYARRTGKVFSCRMSFDKRRLTVTRLS